MEADYAGCNVAATQAVDKIISWKFKDWLQKGPVDVFCDINASILLMKSSAISIKDKHTDVSYHYVCDMVKRREINVDCILLEKMTVDSIQRAVIRNFYKTCEKQGCYFS